MLSMFACLSNCAKALLRYAPGNCMQTMVSTIQLGSTSDANERRSTPVALHPLVPVGAASLVFDRLCHTGSPVHFLRHSLGGVVLDCHVPRASKCLRGASQLQVSWLARERDLSMVIIRDVCFHAGGEVGCNY